jgi:hypothetical protein
MLVATIEKHDGVEPRACTTPTMVRHDAAILVVSWTFWRMDVSQEETWCASCWAAYWRRMSITFERPSLLDAGPQCTTPSAVPATPEKYAPKGKVQSRLDTCRVLSAGWILESVGKVYFAKQWRCSGRDLQRGLDTRRTTSFDRRQGWAAAIQPLTPLLLRPRRSLQHNNLCRVWMWVSLVLWLLLSSFC